MVLKCRWNECAALRSQGLEVSQQRQPRSRNGFKDLKPPTLGFLWDTFKTLTDHMSKAISTIQTMAWPRRTSAAKQLRKALLCHEPANLSLWLKVNLWASASTGKLQQSTSRPKHFTQDTLTWQNQVSWVGHVQSSGWARCSF